MLFRLYLNNFLDEKTNSSQKKQTDNTNKSLIKHIRSILDFSLFKNPSFTLYTIGFGVHIYGHIANFSIIPAHIAKLGYSKQDIAIAVSLIGAFEILARPIFGWFADLQLVQRKYIIISCVFLSGTAAMIIPFFTQFYMILIYSAVVGIVPGAMSSLMSVMILEVVPLKRFSCAIGLIYLVLLVAVCTGKPTAASLLISRHHLMATSVDKGYSWVALAALCFIYMTVAGFGKSFGILYAELLEYYETGSGNTAWISSIALFMLFLIGPVANHLCVIYSVRKVMIFGGCMSSFGMLLSSFVPRMEYWYFTYGIITGVGYGLLFLPCITVVNFHFERRRALANGLVVGGSGIGVFVFPYFYTLVIDLYGPRGAILILSGVFLHICVAASLLRQPDTLRNDEPKKRKKKGDEEGVCENNLLDEKTNSSQKKQTDRANKSLIKYIRSILDFSLFKNLSFTLYTIGFGVQIYGHMANFSIIPAHMAKLDYSEQDIAIAVSLIGAFEILARPVFGWFADLQLVQKKYIVIICVFLAGAAAMIIPFFTQFYMILIYSAAVGIFPGALSSLMSVMILETVPLERFPYAMGLNSLCLSFAVCTGTPTAGWIEDATNTWNHSFRLVGAANFLAGIIFLIESRLKHPKNKNNGEDELVVPEPTVNPETGLHVVTVSLDSEQDPGVQDRLLQNQASTKNAPVDTSEEI